MALMEIDLDLPEELRLCGYERIDQGHAFEVEWDIEQTFTCEKCHRSESTQVQYGAKIQVIRDLDLWGQPSFFVYQPPLHRCGYCHHRQWLLPSFKRKHVTYTYRFEEEVLRLLIGSTEEEVARRLGISAEMVQTIVHHQLQDERKIDPTRCITDIGIDEISLKKGHKLYATILTDLTDPKAPQILAVSKGKDQSAAESCLNHLRAEQLGQILTHRTDMSPAFLAACEHLLDNSQSVLDRFHVAKKLGEMADRVRKKNASVQENAVEGGEEAV